ncbi:hypothetical protein ATCC90586_004125 [Pythium insidiosum]|nr:hypothetical protein ATCC90586_004125 [Pythium insidiosum]
MPTATTSREIMALLAQARDPTTSTSRTRGQSAPTLDLDDPTRGRRHPTDDPQSRWNSSTQIARPSGRALTHQILAPTLDLDDPTRGRRHPTDDDPQSRWNSSTQIARPSGRALTHQILSRTFAPPAPTLVTRSEAPKVVARLTKDTISSRLKDHRSAHHLSTTRAAAVTAAAAAAGGGSGAAAASAAEIEIEMHRTRRHRQRQRQRQQHYGGAVGVHAAATASAEPSSPETSGRDGIQLLLFYRREVEKRLRADPAYMMAQALP